MGCLNFLKKFDPFLKRQFHKLGFAIAKQPGYFIVVPVLLTALFATGFQSIASEEDPEYLFSPINGPAHGERAIIEEFFTMDQNQDYHPMREVGALQCGNVLVSTKQQGDSLLNVDSWAHIITLDQILLNLTVTYENQDYRYKDLCAKFDGKCIGNSILSLNEILPDVMNGSVKLTFPFMLNPKTFDSYVFPGVVGGLNVSDDGVMTSARAVQFGYILRTDKETTKIISRMWEIKFIEVMKEMRFDGLDITFLTCSSVAMELEYNTRSVVPYFVVTVGGMLLFCMLSLSMGDCVRSKTWMGFAGIIVTALSCITSFGILLYLRVPLIGICYVIPFLMLGIGIDDMFVMLAAWRRTALQDAPPRRLADTFADAAVSITITSVTDTLSFFIGALAPIPSVQIFCLYTGVACLVTYLWHISIFGAVLALSGRLEAAQRHAIFGHTVRATSESQDRWWYRLCCAGGINAEDPWNARDNQKHAVMTFFRDYVAAALSRTPVKVVILVAFAAYLCVSVYGILGLPEGLEKRNLVRYDSYAIPFFNVQDRYFSEFPYRVQVAFTGDYNYSDPDTVQQMLDFLKKVEAHEYIADEIFTDSWLRKWTQFVELNGPYIGINNTDEKTYIKNLRETFLRGAAKLDVVFNEDHSRIVAARHLVQAYKVFHTEDNRRLTDDLRQLCNESPLNVTVYHPYFMFMDQFGLIRGISVQTVSIAVGVMVLVSIVFIPNPVCSLWVGFSILSIEIGVVGFMSLWGVSLDSISMIQLIMCIGFSVDFTAHISYAYLSAEVDTAEERIRECLYSLGFPIIQAAGSTLLSIMVLTVVPSYVFTCFFKTIFLVIFLGTIHGIFLLPVLLSLLGPGSCTNKKVEPKPVSDGMARIEESPDTLRIPRPKTISMNPKKAGSTLGR